MNKTIATLTKERDENKKNLNEAEEELRKRADEIAELRDADERNKEEKEKMNETIATLTKEGEDDESNRNRLSQLEQELRRVEAENASLLKSNARLEEEKKNLNDTIDTMRRDSGWEDDVMCRSCMKSDVETRLLVNDSVEIQSRGVCSSKRFFKGVASGSLITLLLLTVIFVLIYIFFPYSGKGSHSSE